MVADIETGTDYLTAAEAAFLIHVGEAAIRRWIDIGMLASQLTGQGQVVVTRDALMEFMRRAYPQSPFLGGGTFSSTPRFLAVPRWRRGSTGVLGSTKPIGEARN